MTTTYVLKPFVLNINDLLYLLAQVNFQPMFDAPVNGNAVVNWDGQSPVYDANGNLYDITGMTQQQAWDAYGHGFPSVTAPIGVRDVSGYHNNLFGTQAHWGAVDVPFRRDIPADYSNYVTSPGADYGTTVSSGTVQQSSVIDMMPRIISRTITTGGVNLLTDGNNHFVQWSAARYAADAAYASLIDAAGVDVSKLVEGAKIVAPDSTVVQVLDAHGQPIIWHLTDYQASMAYTALLAVYSNLSFGGLFGSATGGPLVDGGPIYYHPTPTGPYVQIPGQTYQPDLLAYKQLIDAAGVDFAALVEGEPVTTGVESSGYGLLEQLGHIDFQNPDSGEYFIGSENPGVAPVNSWFAIFGQFFDHGLDLIGKGGQGTTITIELDPSDPLYVAPDPNVPGSGYTAIKITRATVDGADANGDASYVNHTSPFIDQSQTYGSVDQITQLLRKWVSTDGGATYHAGIELFDGATLVDAWERRWPDGSSTMVHDTLPTLNELRQHVIETGRDALTWEDVLNYRNRDASGHVSSGNSGHALILDMNPHFDGATGPGQGHITAASIDKLNAALGLSGADAITPATFNVGMIMAYLNPDFTIKSSVVGLLHEAVSDILMDSVGDHYIAGDGRVNENFGLTSIHHVFHEEHNYQVENLKSWIYQHDAANSPTTHDGLHQWQNDTGVQDGNGNFLNVDGSIAWNEDKMFQATKLIVEMEYQHAAVDQYARTVTPRIQEFVGYSSGVDSTISLEYAQVAFRFGHSTIRETIDTIDPSGWMLGNVTRYALEKAFLAPQTFAEEGVAAITLGLSRQQMNEVDEFITPALSQGLLGQPLDLASINIARGRDIGIPTLNDFRDAIGLARYTSWADYGANMIHPESLVNFIAAYSFGGLADGVAKAQYVLDLAAGLTPGANPFSAPVSAADAVAFLNNQDGANAELNAGRMGFDKLDSWIGGLAEAHVPGGLLGETFDAVFVAQIQSLMDGDRFYYLYRLFGTQIHEEVNNGQFKDIVERNTGLSHLNGSIFAYADKYYDFTRDAELTTPGTIEDDFANHAYGTLTEAGTGFGIFSDGGASVSSNGSLITIDGVTYVRDVRPELDPSQVHPVEGTPTSGADSHEVIVATDNRDFIHARGGDDTVYGEGDDDIIYGGGGVDRLYGGEGNDLIDTGEGPDLADGGAGKDSIYGRGSGTEVGGFDQLVGGSGNDLIVGGEGIDKLSGGSGDDIIYGDGLSNPEMGNTDPFTHAGDGNDYIDGGASGDNLYGEEGDDLVVGGNDQDIIFGGVGDDILRPGQPSQAIGGGPDEAIGDDGYVNSGFDLIDFSDLAPAQDGVVADMTTQANPLIAIDGTTPFPAWWQMEGVIGSQNNDTITGDSALADEEVGITAGNNWLIGGSGNDILRGNGGNDLIVGGSIRLDALIGAYEDASSASGPGNLVVGSSEWLADAMRTDRTASGLNDGYDNDTEDAYTGSSNQATGALSGGLLAGAGFDLHFTNMLRSRMFKDLMLGDGGVDGTADEVHYAGNRTDYTVVGLDMLGNPSTSDIFAYMIIDGGGENPDGTVRAPADGTDIVLGVESFVFADVTLSAGAELLNRPPTIDGGATRQLTLDENQTTVATLTASDPDNLPLIWSIIGGADSGLFAIDEATGALTLVSAANFELPGDANGDNVYDVVVRVTDQLGAADTQTISLAIGNVNEAATGALHISGYTATNTSATLTASSTVADGDLVSLTNPSGAVIGFQWQRLVGGTWQNIGGATGATLANQANTTVRVTQQYTDAFGAQTVVSAETAFITASNGANARTGTTGADIMLGLGGSDTLTGGDGNDTVDGGSGNDRFVATVADGDDRYIGGSGTDTYDLSGTGGGVAISVAAGVVTAVGTETGTDTLTGVENFIGSQWDDTIFVNGNANRLEGLGGNDNIDAGGGNDTVLGGVGADTISGGSGNDQIDGGAGLDLLTGGGGNDDFNYTASIDSQLAAMDTIMDFSAGNDEFGLQAFNFGGTRNDAIIERLVGTFTATSVTDFFDANPGPGTLDRAVVVEYITGNGAAQRDARLYVDANADGNFDSSTDMVVLLKNINDLALSMGDFNF